MSKIAERFFILSGKYYNCPHKIPFIPFEDIKRTTTTFFIGKSNSMVDGKMHVTSLRGNYFHFSIYNKKIRKK